MRSEGKTGNRTHDFL